MNGIRRILAALVGIALAFAAIPTALASVPPHGGAPASTSTTAHVIAGSGMPGWQITLIAAGAALAAAALAVFLDRARMARKAHGSTA